MTPPLLSRNGRAWRNVAAAVAIGLIFVGPMSTAPIQAGTQTAPAMRAADFLDTLGVNIHIGSHPYNDPARLSGLLGYLAIRNVRQSSPIDAAGLAMMQQLGRSGAKFDLIVNGGGPVELAGAMRTVHDMAPYLNAVEGVNEAALYPITYRGIGGVDAAVALQKDLFAAVRASPALKGVAVYMFTLGGIDPGAFPSIGDQSAHADFANVHSYPPHGLRPIFVIHAAIDGGRTSAATRPVVLTETGFYTLPNHDGWGGVPEAVQASYLLDLLLDEAAAGVARTYLYDLIDDGADPKAQDREQHFGLFRFDGSPKLAATALHNLTTILADPGDDNKRFTPAPLPFTALGVPYNHTGNTLALQKRDGTQIIALWNEQQLWNPDTKTAQPVAHIPTTVSFPTRQSTALLYDPLLGVEPVAAFHDAQELTIDLTDHPLLLVLKPGGTTSTLSSN